MDARCPQASYHRLLSSRVNAAFTAIPNHTLGAEPCCASPCPLEADCTSRQVACIWQSRTIRFRGSNDKQLRVRHKSSCAALSCLSHMAGRSIILCF